MAERVGGGVGAQDLGRAGLDLPGTSNPPGCAAWVAGSKTSSAVTSAAVRVLADHPHRRRHQPRLDRFAGLGRPSRSGGRVNRLIGP